ncbi:MAG TPA: copper resistance protein CopC [Candidatus Agrococcus pullicola]|uniref:Copper resistance protein CopC n=1 Tax=Candidatus Agrococcus pullicola TaxID=2838429 RepID=A0A9D2CA57_9MICO|nr:copper resistance protein CopC [Candidatus Agrococcus pullicola]
MQLLAAVSVISSLVLPLPAHATVIDSTVEDGGTLTESVETLSVTMDEEILQVPGVETANVLTLQDASGNYYGDGCTTVEGPSASMVAALGEAGEYVFAYTVVSADTHPVSGEIAFTWEPPADHEPSPALPDAPVCGEEPQETAVPESNDDSAQEPEATDTDVAEETTTDDAAQEEGTEEGGVPPWVFILVSVAAVALIIGLIIGNWVRARRMWAGWQDKHPDENHSGDDSRDDRQ